MIKIRFGGEFSYGVSFRIVQAPRWKSTGANDELMTEKDMYRYRRIPLSCRGQWDYFKVTRLDKEVVE
jgi:hypothetical protein